MSTDLIQQAQQKRATLLLEAAAIPLAEMEARRARIALDGAPRVTANVFPAFSNEYAVVDAWQRMKPTSVTARVSGTTVTINWVQGSAPVTAVYRNGAQIPIEIGSGNGLGTSDTPGPGTWTYGVQAVNGFYFGEIAYAAAVIVEGTQPPPSSGWTDLTPPVGALVFYVSNSIGSDDFTGITPTTPFKTIAKGLSMLRNGQPDQCLLKCGDTWTLTDQITLTKSANSQSKYMVLGSYGAGPRPIIRTPSHGIFGGNQGQRNGFAIVGLDLAPISITQGSDGIVLLSTTGNSWDDVLIEDCYIHGYSAGIVMQVLTDGNVFQRCKIRRSVIVDNDNNGGGHAQGIFLGGAANWLIEECVIDNNARSKADMFCHNLYCHEWSGPGIFRGNLSSRACSHGFQQRPGGTTENNLLVQNPINGYIGANSMVYGPTVNRIRYNVAIDSRNINATDVRGLGFVIEGAAGSVFDFNLAAHQKSGTANVTAVDCDGFKGSMNGNAVYDWNFGGNGWGQAFQIGGNGSQVTAFTGNRAWMPTGGICVSGTPQASSGNQFWTVNPIGGYPQFGAGNFAQYQAAAHDSGSVFVNPGAKDATIARFLQTKSIAPGSDPVATFAGVARAGCSKQAWNPIWLEFNTWARGVMGVAQPVAP